MASTFKPTAIAFDLIEEVAERSAYEVDLEEFLPAEWAAECEPYIEDIAAYAAEIVVELVFKFVEPYAKPIDFVEWALRELDPDEYDDAA